MTTLVIGASGATGRLLVEELLRSGQTVKVVVRSRDRLPDGIRHHPGLITTEAGILDLSDAEMRDLVKECDAVASCLGHNMTFRGMFGRPRRLVRDATRRLCAAIRANAPATPVKYVLMNTAGNRNRDLGEHISLAQKCVMVLLRLLVPPHVDNEQAADVLRLEIGQDDPAIEWAAVRPDGLVDQDHVTDYHIHGSPTRSAIFDAGRTSRINVAHFMARLITDPLCWHQWRGQMPVIYNQDAASASSR